MTNIALNTGLRSLISSQFALDTIGHNISNANTTGYSRQQVNLSASIASPQGGLLIGNGVNADSVERTVDKLLNSRIRNQVNASGALDRQLSGLREIESIFDEPSDSSISALLDGFFSSVSELTSDPSDSIRRSGVTQSAVSLTTQINGVASRLNRVSLDTEQEVRTRVEEANLLAQQIADLNVQIGETQAQGLDANDLSDERGRKLSDLAGLIDVQTLDGTNGSVNVLVAGNTLVSSSRANALQVDRDSTGDLKLSLQGSTGFVPAKGGAIGGLLDLGTNVGPELRTQLDALARNLIQEVNRVHATGLPAGGPMSQLTAAYGFEDQDGDGRVRDELVSRSGLPFDLTGGSLTINITDKSTGKVTANRVDISSTHTTVTDLLDSLNEVDGLSAELDSLNRLRIVAGAGFGFDFSPRLDPDPDSAGTFGGGRASLGTGFDQPFGLADGDTLDLTVDPSGASIPISIDFQSQDFREISQATAEEVAAVINANPDAQTTGIVAVAAGDKLYVQTAGEGSSADYTLDGGSSTAAFGWNSLVGTTIVGHDRSADVSVSGAYTGTSDETFSFEATKDGTIGTTDGLVVEVRDSTGNIISTLDVGSGYEPGSELEVAAGIRVSFGLGDLSSTNNDGFVLEAVSESDTAGVLVATGLNSLFVGTNAADIAVRGDLQADPSLLAASQTGAEADTGLLLQLLDVENTNVEELDNASLGSFYGSLIGDVGFQTATTQSALESNDLLISSLEQRRDQVSGVNVDEELVDLVRFQQSFAAAAQFISTVNQLGDELLNLI